MAQSTIRAWVDTQGYGPDLSLVAVVYFGLRAPLSTGASCSVLLGLCRDATGGGILGFYAGVFLFIFLAVQILHQKIDPTTPFYIMLLMFILYLTTGLVSIILLHIFGSTITLFPRNWSSPIAVFLVSGLTTSIITPVVFRLLRFFQPSLDTRKEQDA